MPSKANPEVQRNFLYDTLMPLIDKAKSGLIQLYFLDASHFVMGGFPGRVWSIVRKWVKTSSGRQRFNVLGALNFITKKIETITNNTYITSTQIIEMLQKLATLNAGKSVKVILDNAKYQRCKVVFEAAALLGIELIYLPTYSPNLNLIERVWKLVKSRVLNSVYYETFERFSLNIEDCVKNLHSRFSKEVATLITSKFCVVDELNVIN